MPRTRARSTEYTLTPLDVAHQLGKSRKTVDNWRYQDPPQGPAFKLVGPYRHPRYCQRDVDAYVVLMNTVVDAEPATRPRKNKRR